MSDTEPQEFVGPAPIEGPQPKKRRRLSHENLYLDNLPSAECYEKSYMHRDVITHCLVSSTDFIITASCDGHIKFWKKVETGIEFVKHFRSHLGPITKIACNQEGTLLCSASADKSLKIFDVVNFDMINMMKLDYSPGQVEWVHGPGDPIHSLAVTDSESPRISIYDGRSDNKPLKVLDKMHTQPVCLIKYNHKYDVAVSVDKTGMLEYWSGLKQDCIFPRNVKFDSKLDTDLFEFAKNKTVPTGLAFAPDGARFATISTDRRVRVFNFVTGKLVRVLDETLPRFTELQQQTQQLPNMEFGRRMAAERDLEKSEAVSLANIVFDYSGHFIMYATLLGIKLVNLYSNKCVKIIGKNENLRLLNLALYQVLHLPMASSRESPDDDGYKRFTEDTHVSYGSNNANAIDEMGSRSSLSRETSESVDHWEMNYHEAAIFLEEGENNEKFDSHPRHPSALPAYLLVHNSWYYGLDLAFSIILLLLALAESPSVDKFQLPVGVHSTLELVSLGVIGVELALKLRWIGWSMILRHKRTMVKGVTLFIMVLEAVVVLVRQSSHFRVTRALRPIFLVDTRACGAVRRFIRQILQSLPPILDMLVLLMFFVCSYALLGYFLFSTHQNNLYFRTLSDSFVSMFVLLTTANFPDVMMPSYAISKWNAIFFVSYISTVLYVLMNLMLAVVYETFTGIEKDKFRKLLLHKRKACQLAFRLLVSKQTPNMVRFRQFHGLVRYYSPRTSQRDIILIYRQLNASGTGALTEDEFLGIYDAVTLKWRLKDPPDPWFSAAWPPLRMFCRAARKMVTWEYFEHIIYVLIVGNGLAMFIRVLESSLSLEEGARNFCASWDSFLFYTLFLAEALLRIVGLGWGEYISSGWNFFDLSVTLIALLGSLSLLIQPKLTGVVILRPLRLLRLFKLKKRYRDIFGTLVLLSPLMWSTAIVMMVMYYFFAIIGMELFSKYDLRNCCVNTTVEDFYKYSANSSSAIGYYYLNNFSNLLISGVTLFELTVVNNWFIVMDAYASVAHPYSRIFFMLFYLFTMVVLTIVVASVLEAFRFRIQYKKQTSKRDEEQMLHEEVAVDWTSLQRQVQDPKLVEAVQVDFVPGGVAFYTGRRRRTREVLQRHMYISEIAQWLQEAEEQERISGINLVDDSQMNARLMHAEA